MEEYDEDEIGALDHEEMTGTVDPDSQILNALAEDFEHHVPKVHFADVDGTKQDKAKTSRQAKNKSSSEDDSDDDEDIMRIDVTPKEQWDCESILSTYSNLYNHPTLIKEAPKNKSIKLSTKTGIPLGVIPGKTSAKNNNCSEDMDVDIAKQCTGPRPKHEDKDDKALRKRAVKEQRRARRVEKKSNKLTFKAEQKRQEQSLMNTKHQQGQKL
ncbi:Protein LTV1-like [Exaiptasia diaphana]|nr:Protein LTV1-like [Exaiptasia diaphana]